MTDYSITTLKFSFQNLSKLPDDIHLYTKLIALYCHNNKLTNLPELPSSLQYLYCYNNPFYDELGYNLTIETISRYNEEINNMKMIDYVLK
jgi:Leucine-rich repeat (LRR) protein